MSLVILLKFNTKIVNNPKTLIHSLRCLSNFVPVALTHWTFGWGNILITLDNYQLA